MDTRTKDESERAPRGRGRGVNAASGLFQRLLKRALGTLRPSIATPDKLSFEAFEPRVLLSGDPSIPRIDGSLDAPGETDRYSFTLPSDLRVVFDSLTSNGNMRWSLDGPRGNVVSDRPLSQSDSADRGGDVAYELPAGEYMLTVDGVGDTTGAYGFRLIDLNQAQEIQVGTQVSGELSPAAETDAFKFSGVAGQRFFIDRLDHSNDVYWRLIDPFGRTVSGPAWMGSDLGELTLGVDGSYTLLVEGRASAGGTAAYRFSVTLVDDPATQAMAVGEVVAGSINTAGARQTYTFTLDGARRLLFDALTNNSRLSWSLARGDGSVVASRAFTQSDSWEVANNPALFLGAGDYRLTIDGEGDATGVYRLRLLDMAATTPFTPGSDVSGQFGQVGVSVGAPRVDGGAPVAPAAGQTNRSVRVDAGSAELWVADAASLQVDLGLTIEAWIRPTGPGSDAVYGGIIVNKEGEYELARLADGRIAWAIANAAPGWDWVETDYVAALDTWTHVAFVYDGAVGRVYANGELVHEAAATGAIGDTASGQNRLQIGSRQVGGQRFEGQIDEVRVWSVARSADEIDAAFDQTVAADAPGLAGYWRFDEATGTLLDDSSAANNDGTLAGAFPTETQLFGFDAVAGQRFFFDSLQLAGDNFSVRLFDPAGQVVWGPQWFSDDRDVFTVPRDGRYVLALEGRIGHQTPANWRFNLQPVQDRSDALALGTRVDASFEHPGQKRHYTFTLDAPTKLVFDALNYRTDMAWSLLGPGGVALVAGRRFGASDSSQLGGSTALQLAAGDYTLSFDADGAALGTFAFQLLNLAQAEALAYGADLAAVLDPGNLTRIYRVDATAGDRVLFDLASMSGGNAHWRLIDPTGKLVFGPDLMNADRGPVTLLLDGPYSLLVEGQPWEAAPVSVAFKLVLDGNDGVPALEGTAIDIGTRVDGTISAAGETDDYLFTLDGPTRIVFDALAPGNVRRFQFSIEGPRGTELGARWFYDSESFELGADPAIDLPLAGTYRVRVTAPSSGTGDYAFRLLDLSASAIALTPGTPVDGALNPANETDIYRFQATAGQRLYFDMRALAPNNGDWASWRLYDPSGRTLFGPTGFYVDNDIATLTMPVTGSYTLLVEGRIWTVTSGVPRFDYSFNVQPVSDRQQPVQVGERVDGSIQHAGQAVEHQFTLDEARRLLLDVLAPSSTTPELRWSLTGPDGTLVSGRRWYDSESYELGGTSPVLDLAAGTYTLRVNGQGGATGDFAFRLLDLADAEPFALDAQVDGTLDASNSTRLYAFEATAGDRLFFDMRGLAPNNGNWVSWRMIDPSGRQVSGPHGFHVNNDIEGLVAARSGTYTLVIEGRVWTVANNVPRFDYGFALNRVNDLAATLQLGATTTGSIGVAGQRITYGFSLAQASQLLFDALAPVNNNPDFRWTLRGPRGVEVDGRQLYSSESYELGGTSPLLNLIAGDYTLVIDPVGDQTGSFAFRLIDLAQATTVQVNEPVAATLDPVNQTDVYRFSGSKDKLYYVDRQQLSAGGADWYTWRLFDEFGRQLIGPSNLNDIDLFTLPRDGSYTLLVEGRIWTPQNTGPVAYSFKLLEITDDVVDIMPGQAYGLERLPSPGVIDGALRLDSLRQVQVPHSDDTAQTGSTTIEFWFKADSFYTTWQPLVYKGNGNGSQRSYSLWLNSAGYLHLSSGNNYNETINTANGSIVAGNWVHVSAVIDRANNVQKIYLDGVEAASGALRANSAGFATTNPLLLGSSAEGNPPLVGAIDDFRLWGRALTAEEIAEASHRNAALQGDEDGLVVYLPMDGGGSALADATGRGNDGSAVHAWQGTPAVVAGEITFGQKDVYRFTLDATKRIYFDSLTDNSRLNWTLSGPRGTLVSARTLQTSDSENGLFLFDLPAGDYTLVVDGQGDATGAYGFRLLDLAEALPLVLDSTVQGTLQPANQTQAYRFDAVAGERMYFDVTATSGGVPFWRLIDPFGRTVWGPNYMPSDDVRTQTLAFSGTYTLLVEGRRDAGNGASSYGLRVQRIVDRTVPIAVGQSHDGLPALGPGQIGQALQFNGLQGLELADDETLDVSRSLTIEAWVKVDAYDNTWTPIFYKGDSPDGNQRAYSVWLQNNGSVWFGVRDASGQQAIQTAGGLVPAGEWHHIAVVMDRDGGNLRVLVDGEQRASGGVRSNQNNIATTAPLRIGVNTEHNNSYSNFRGALDDIRVWNVARSNEDIAAGRATALSGIPSGLIAYLPADALVAGTLADASGNGRAARFGNVLAPMVQDRIEHVGQRVNFSFTLSEATRLYVDTLTESSALLWSLSGPRGLLVGDRRFDQSDSENGLSLLDLPAGDYLFTVRASNDTTGNFAFRLLDLAEAQSLTPGDVVTGQLTPGVETDLWAFDAVAGQSFQFDVRDASGGYPFWRLIDPFGATVFGPNYMPNDDVAVRTLAATGRYTLLVEGRRNAGGDSSYSLAVQPVVVNSAALTLGAAVAGNIATVGGTDRYSFSLSEARTLVFDSRLNSTTFKWWLRGPTGDIVSGRNFADSDSADFNANPLLALGPGDYTLTVDPDRDATGAYGFRLVDLAAAGDVPTIALDSEVAGTLDPGSSTHFFAFDANAREQLRLDLISESRNSAYWRLIGPDGKVLFGPAVTDDRVVTIPVSGRYVLLLEGRVSEGTAVDYRFAVQRTAQANPSGHTTQDFDADGLPYALASFSNAAPALVDGGNGGNVLRLLPGSVTGTNTVGFVNTAPGVQPGQVQVSFDLRITKVSNQGDGIGFAWLDALTWGDSGPAPQFGEEPNLARSFGVGFDPVNNSERNDNHVSLHFDGAKLAEFDVPGFRLDAGAWQRARIVMAAADGGSNVSVYLRPEGGDEIAIVENYFVSGLRLAEGRAAFGARNGGWRADNDLDNIAVTVTPGTLAALPAITLGEVLQTTLGSSSERDLFTLTLDQAKRLYFDTLTVNVNGGDSFWLRWSLYGPDGRPVVLDKPFRESDSSDGTSILDLAAGTYTFEVRAANNIAGAYRFRWLDLGAATELTLDQAVTGQFDPANETDAYRFNGTAGDKLYFDITQRSGSDARWRLLGPDGSTVFGPADFNSTTSDVALTLAQTGRYTLLVEARYYRSDTGSYGFMVRRVQDPPAADIALGDTVSATMARGQTHVYRFSLDEDTRAVFDSLTVDVAGGDSFYLRWALSGPRGTVTSDRPFRQSDSADGVSIMDLAAGDYTLTVTTASELAGDYRFRLLDLDAGAVVALGDLVSGSFDPANESDVYTFDAAGGERVFFDVVSRSGSDARWTVLDPFGRALFSQRDFNSSGGDFGPTVLPYAGRYTVLVEARYYRGDTGSYAFRVQPVQDEALEMQLDVVQNQSIAHAGQRDVYSFTLTETKRVYFDALATSTSTDNYYLRWSLSGPRGLEVNDQPWRTSDSADGSSILLLGPGSYTLTVRNPQDTTTGADITGDYGFRLLDLSNATPLTTGTPISGVLNPASQTDAYRFDALAGDRFFFDRRTQSGGDTYWRLLDPWGRTLWGPSGFGGDVDVTTLPYEGTYTLLIEGRYYVGGTASYEFNVSPSPLQAPVVIDLVAQPGPNLVLQSLTVEPVGDSLRAGGQVLVRWQVGNAGNQPAAAEWVDRLLVRNLDRGNELIGNVLIEGDEAAFTPLLPGESRVRQVLVTLAGGARGAGNLRFELTTDVSNTVVETGAGELDNTRVATALSELSPYPDLQVDSVAVEPASGWVPGDTVTLRWRVLNSGDSPATGAFADAVVVRNADTGVTLLNTSLAYDPAVDGAIASGEFRQRSLSFTWPAGVAGAGRIEFRITTDIDGSVFESNPTDTAEANNSSLATLVSAPDLRAQNLRVEPGSLSAGGALTLRWDDINAGLSPTLAGWNDRVRVINVDTGETLLDTVLAYNPALPGNAPLAVGATLTRSTSLQLPEGLRGTGRIRFEVTADQNTSGQGALIEYDAAGVRAENNNGASIEAVADARPYANLVVAAFSAPLTGRGGSTIDLSWTVRNDGGAAAEGGWVDRLLLSRNNVFGDADDVLLAEVARNGALAAGATYVGQRQVTLPLQLDGSFFLSVVADATQQVLEPDTRADNTAAPRAVALESPRADLRVEVVDAPAAAFGGQPITLAWRVRNDGDAVTSSASWKDRIYLSTDDVLSAGDLLLAEVSREATLAAGASYSQVARLFAPNGLDGSYRFIVATDAGNQVYEGALDGNNSTASLAPTALSPAPVADLQVAAIELPEGGVPGTQRTVRWTITNAGDAAATGTWTDRVYLSADGTLANATLLGSVALGRSIAAGDSYTQALDFALPSLADGDYRIVVVTDAVNQLFESPFDGNNTLASTGTLTVVHPDLQAEALRAPPGAESASLVALEWEVRNVGSAALSGTWTDRVYLSRDDVLDANDRLVVEQSAARSLAIGESYVGSGSFTLPVEASGDYRLIVVSDAGNAVAELNAEGNNRRSAAFSVDLAPYADLVVTDIVAPDRTIDDPALITVQWTVQNQGNGAGLTSEWADVIIASADGVFGNGDDRVLGRFQHAGALAAGAEYTRSETFYLPAAFEGRFTLFVRTDQDAQVFENGLEANNLRAKAEPFDVMRIPYADLVIDALAPQGEARSGQALDVRWVVRNQGIGLTNTDAWIDRLFLSPNPDGSERVALGQFTHLGFLAPDGSYERVDTVTLPDGISGTWYLVLENGGPFEFIYGNNNRLISGPFDVALSPAPDLVVSNITVPETAPEGSAIDIGWTVTNQGQAVADGIWTDTVYLRKFGDTGTGISIGSFQFQGPLEAGKSYSRREQIILPSKTSDRYELIVVTDQTNVVYESEDDAPQELNNRSVDDAQISVSVLPRPDLQVFRIDGPESVDAGGTATIEFEIINQGPVATTVPNWVDRVYLSLDDKITVDDVLVATHTNGSALESGERYLTPSSTFKVPERFRGNVYVIVQTDAGGAMEEWPNEGNNVRLFELFVNPWPFADLVVHDVKVPAQAFEGNQVEVRYTVTNRGSGATDKGQWAEQIWLTKDKNRPHPGQGDVLLTSFNYTDGVLGVGEGYDRIVTVTLPASVRSGEYYLTPWVDPYATLLEDTLAINVNPDDPNAVNNNNYKAGGSDLIGFRVIGTPPVVVFPDLEVTSVVPELQEWAGENFTVSWTVRNNGQGIARGGYDEVYVSDNAVLDAPGANQFYLGRFDAPQELSFGQSYTQTHTLLLEPTVKGRYVHVRTFVTRDSDTSNDKLGADTDVRDRIPDLKVTAIVPEAQAFSGEKTVVRYTVTNDSAFTIWPQTRYWTDQIYLSKDPVWIPNRDRVTLLSAVQIANSGLASGASYSREIEVTLPPGIEGPYYLYVFTNAGSSSALPPLPPAPTVPPFPVVRGDGVHDAGNTQERYFSIAYENPTNNMARASLPVIYREPDLRVTDLQLPATVAAGATVSVSYTVTNVGNRETREDSWTDRIFISYDASLDTLDAEITSAAARAAILAKYGRDDGKLRPGESYTATVQMTVPYDLNGEYHVLAFADANRRSSVWAPISAISPRLRGLDTSGGAPSGVVREFQGEGNNITARAVTVQPYAPPDLRVTALSTDLRAVRGQSFDVAYTVSNLGGSTPAEEAAWDDLIYLSRDNFLDTKADRFIGSIRRTGGLQAGASYEVARSFTVPTDLATEAYYVFVVTDPLRYGQKGEVFESDERNNARASDVPMVIEQPPPTDLVVSNIVVPPSVRSGQPIQLSWTVTNQSDVAASGSWTDSVFLSEDAVWDITDRPLGRASYSGTLQPDGTYTLTLDTLMPAAAPGNYRVIVRTDVFNQVYEGVQEANNRSASPGTIQVAVDALQIGAPLVTTLAPKQERLYQIQVPDGQTLRITLDSSDPAATNEIFIRHGRVPTSAVYDATYTGPLASDLTAIVPSTEPGTYYVLVRNYGAAPAGTQITLLAELLPLLITDVHTDTGGDSKHVTTTIRGAQFQPGAIVKLVRPGIAEYEPLVWEVVDSTQIIATFDFTGAPHGLYDLKVINPDGSEAIVPYRFLIERAVEPEVTIGLGGPRIILAGDQATYSVALQGISNVDAPYTYFEVGVPQLLFNPIVYGLPYLEFFTNVRGTPEGAAGSANEGVPWAELESITNTDGQLLTSGFLYDQPTEGFSGFTFNVVTYPGLREMHERAFEQFRGKMANYFPELDELLEDGPAGLEDWWSAVKAKAEDLQPGLGAAMDQLDFVGMYNKNEAVPDECVIPFIPFRFHMVAAATTMTRAEYVDFQSARAKDLRSAILASDDAPGALLALAADEQIWVDLYLAALEDAELLRPDGATPPIRTQQHIVSLMSVISSGILFGPGGAVIRSDADLLGFFEKVRELYGHDQYKLAEIEYWDQRESDCYTGEVPVPAIPEFEDYNLNLTAPTHFEAFRVYVPWMPFESRGAGIPPEFQISGPEEVGGEAFVTLDFGKYLKGSAGEGRLASITGPQTMDTGGWLPIDQALPYTVNFENSTSASGFVNEVQIVTQLDPDLDPYTFQLGDIRIGDIDIDIPEGRWSYQADIDYTYTKGFILRVSAGIDTYQNPAGVSWVLQAIDPLTGELLQDRTRGLLAPNDGLGAGAGFVSFTVEARSPDEVKVTDKTPLNQRPDGIVRTSARVLFDSQAPEDTLVIEQRVDAAAPTTQLRVERVSGTDSYTVEWAASDAAGGAGFKHVTLYVAVDGGDFKIWQRRLETSSGQLVFDGEAGKTYEFLALSTDIAGNREKPTPGINAQADGGPANLGALPQVPNSTPPNFGLPPPPVDLPSTNEVFQEAQQGIPNVTPPTRPSEFDSVLRPFVGSVFADGFVTSHAGIGPMAIAEAPDGTILISGGENRGDIWRFNRDGGSAADSAPWVRHSEPIFNLAFDDDGRLWATTGGGALLQLDADTGAVLARHGSGITIALAVEPGRGRLFVSTNAGVSVFDPSTGLFEQWSRDENLRVGSLAFDNQGNLWAVTWPDRRQVVKFTAFRRAELMLEFDSDLDSIAFGRNGTYLEDLLFVSHNAGPVDSTGAARPETELTMVDVATLKRIAVATGGTRGDVVFATSDGRVLISQGDQVDLLAPTAPPRVVATSPADGGTLPLPLPFMTVVFDQDMFVGDAAHPGSVLNPANYKLVGDSVGEVTLQGLRYDPATRSVLLVTGVLQPDRYTLTVQDTLQSVLGERMGGDHVTRFDAINNLSALIDLQFGLTRYDRATGTLSYEITLRNKGDVAVTLPAVLLLDPRDGYSGVPQSAQGRTDDGRWLIDLSANLPPGGR
ncbi:MAG: LEPR-XLL domain-containing protein, partial [Burkholderiales bacterium]|nr:LEPR-XLL domain-containing protein [Burkholderiales bacterium]